MAQGLKKRYSIKLLSSVINGVVGAILVAIVPKALSPIAYGQFIYLQDFFAKIIGFLDMGSSIAFFTKLSSNNSRKELIGFYFLYSFSILVLVLLFISILDRLGYLELFIPNIPAYYIYFGLFFGFFTWFIQIFIKISDAFALTLSVESIKVVHKLLSLLFLFYFVYYTNFNLERYFYFHYISLITFLLILIWLFREKGVLSNLQFKIQNFKLITKEFIEYCHPLVIYNLINIMVGIFDIWLLQKMGGSREMGFYGLAYSLATICFLFTVAMTPIITREFAKSYGEGNIKRMGELFSRYIPMLYGISAYFAIFLAMQSKNILIIFTDENFKNAYYVLIIMAFYPIHQTYGQLSGSLFYATGQTKLIRNISLLTQPLGVIISFILIYILNLGAIGLALKMVIIQIIGVNVQLYFNLIFLNLKIKQFIWHQIYSVTIFMLLAILSNWIIDINSPYLEFFISGLLYTVWVIIFLYFLPQIFAITKDEIKSILLRLKNVIKRKT